MDGGPRRQKRRQLTHPGRRSRSPAAGREARRASPGLHPARRRRDSAVFYQPRMYVPHTGRRVPQTRIAIRACSVRKAGSRGMTNAARNAPRYTYRCRHPPPPLVGGRGGRRPPSAVVPIVIKMLIALCSFCGRPLLFVRPCVPIPPGKRSRRHARRRCCSATSYTIWGCTQQE